METEVIGNIYENSELTILYRLAMGRIGGKGMNINEAIEQLKYYQSKPYVPTVKKVCDIALEAIETLQQENQQLRDTLHDAKCEIYNMPCLCYGDRKCDRCKTIEDIDKLLGGLFRS